jgi:hypothetical protein
MGTESPPEFPTLSTSNSPAGFLDEASLFERTDILSTSSTSQGPQHGAVDWLTWEETTLQSSAVYIVQLFKYWLVTFILREAFSNLWNGLKEEDQVVSSSNILLKRLGISGGFLRHRLEVTAILRKSPLSI